MHGEKGGIPAQQYAQQAPVSSWIQKIRVGRDGSSCTRGLLEMASASEGSRPPICWSSLVASFGLVQSHHRLPGILYFCFAFLLFSATVAAVGALLRGPHLQGAPKGKWRFDVSPETSALSLGGWHPASTTTGEPQTSYHITASGVEPSRNQSTVKEFLDSEKCRETHSMHQKLVHNLLKPFQAGFSAEYLAELRPGVMAKNPHSPVVTFYVSHGQLYIKGGAAGNIHPMILSWATHIRWFLQEVKLPDMILPMNLDDYPLGTKDPWFSFCRQPRLRDLLLPNIAEDGIFALTKPPTPPRAGRNDTRLPQAVWLGRPMAWENGKRKAIVKEGQKYPERVHAGLTDWEGVEPAREAEWLLYQKPRIPLSEWSNIFKYVVNVAGNCGSIRLANQLYSDSAVFLVTGHDEEWFYPLLEPYVHFIPVTIQVDGSTDLADKVAWAEAHPDEVADIVRASTELATQHLLPTEGRECYSLLLLSEFSKLISTRVRPPAGLLPFVLQQPRGPVVPQ